MQWRRYLRGQGLLVRHVQALRTTKERVTPAHSVLPPPIPPGRPRHERRNFSLSSIPTVLLPPVVFSGLLVTLWTYKCLMMIIFQNKIIYMPSMPPFSRSEKVADYANECGIVEWREKAIKSLDGTCIYLLEGAIPNGQSDHQIQKHIIVVYLQGNGSSLPPRLPYLSSILKKLQGSKTEVRYTIVALSYRGFWKSSGSPNQPGIELDAQAALRWVSEEYGELPYSRIVLWGQSIGGGVATTSMASLLSSASTSNAPKKISICGLLLETPFVSLKTMLISLYPQKFLPYRYLHPFLKSTWDSEWALSKVGHALDDEGGSTQVWHGLHTKALKVLILEAGEDELVPEGDAERLLNVCRGFQSIDAQHKVVTGAFHTNVIMKSGGQKEIIHFITQFEH